MIDKKIKNTVFHDSRHVNDIHLTTIDNNKLLGFWIYLMSDCIIFAILFAVYAILSRNVSMYLMHQTFFKLSSVLLETSVLLLSSLSCGFMTVSMMNNSIKTFFVYFFITFVLGFSFIIMEIYEFYNLIIQNLGPSRHAFSSAFFTLIGSHGIHVICGLIWMLSIFYQIFCLGLTNTIRIRILCFSLFWHFLDVIWVCVFTFVYLNGAV